MRLCNMRQAVAHAPVQQWGMSAEAAWQQCVAAVLKRYTSRRATLCTAAPSPLTFKLVAAWCSSTLAGLNSISLTASLPIPKAACGACTCAAAVGTSIESVGQQCITVALRDKQAHESHCKRPIAHCTHLQVGGSLMQHPLRAQQQIPLRRPAHPHGRLSCGRLCRIGTCQLRQQGNNV